MFSICVRRTTLASRARRAPRTGWSTSGPVVSALQSGWYTVNPTNVTIQAVDPISGIAWIQYAWGTNNACTAGTPYTCTGGSTCTTAIAMPVNPTGLQTLYMCAQNNAGVQVTANAAMAVDTTVPTVSTAQSGWYTVPSNAIITTSPDNVSGIAWTQYSWDTNNACTAGTTYTAPIAIPAGNGGLHTLYMCAQTIAGLQGTASAAMGVDTTTPAVSTAQSGWYTVATDAVITSTDSVSGHSLDPILLG